MASTLQVGQKLWYVPSRRQQTPYEVTVKSVGRKWAQLDPVYMGRISIETLAVDGGSYSSPGRCYISRQDYERQSFLNACWRDLVNDFDRIRYGECPKHLGLEQIKQIRQMLGLQVLPDSPLLTSIPCAAPDDPEGKIGDLL